MEHVYKSHLWASADWCHWYTPDQYTNNIGPTYFYRHVIKCQLTHTMYELVDSSAIYRPTLDWVSIGCWSRCWSSVDIKLKLENTKISRHFIQILVTHTFDSSQCTSLWSSDSIHPLVFVQLALHSDGLA